MTKLTTDFTVALSSKESSCKKWSQFKVLFNRSRWR